MNSENFIRLQKEVEGQEEVDMLKQRAAELLHHLLTARPWDKKFVDEAADFVKEYKGDEK